MIWVFTKADRALSIFLMIWAFVKADRVSGIRSDDLSFSFRLILLNSQMTWAFMKADRALVNKFNALSFSESLLKFRKFYFSTIFWFEFLLTIIGLCQ